MEENKTERAFTIWENYLEAMSPYSEEEQAYALLAMVKYAFYGEVPDKNKNKLGYSMVKHGYRAINNSVARHEKGSVDGTKGGRPSLASEEEVKNYLIENPNATSSQVAQYFGVTASTIQKKEAWKNRRKQSIQKEEENIDKTLPQFIF